MAIEKVLLLDSDRLVLETYRHVLEASGYGVLLARTPREALELLSAGGCQAVVAELTPPGPTEPGETFDTKACLDLIRAAKSIKPDPYAVVITPHDLALEGYSPLVELGVEDFLSKPFRPESLLLSLKKAERAAKQKDRLLSLENGLIFYSQHFQRLLEHECSVASRQGQDLSLVMLKLNGHNGPVTRKMAEVLQENLRLADLVALSEEGLALLLPATPAPGAEILCERLKAKVNEVGLKAENGSHRPITYGLASYVEQEKSAEKLLQTALQIDHVFIAPK
jgi:PleD family two-component response regulator